MQEKLSKIVKYVMSLKNDSEAERFFTDLLTRKEIDTLFNRLTAAEYLAQKISYRKIYHLIDVSPTTLTKVNNTMVYGEGGLRLIQKRLKAEDELETTQEKIPVQKSVITRKSVA